MTEENTKKLHDSYPRLYVSKRWFECGDGWFDLINECSAKIEQYNNTLGQDLDDQANWCVALQVKEKFGTLRFYVQTSNDIIQAAIREAERKSAITCKHCGKPGRLFNEFGWLGTMCESCATDIVIDSLYRVATRKDATQAETKSHMKEIVERTMMVLPPELKDAEDA